jgi:hypothetical protein
MRADALGGAVGWRTLGLAGAIVLALVTLGRAATVVVNNQDGPGEGFNDPSSVAPVGGNPGTTLGAQRLNAFEFAADIWGGVLESSVVIDVDATMDPLPCNASNATLGQASPTTVVRDFSGALFPNTWYPLALANKLAGTDVAGGSSDITAQFSSVIGTTCAIALDWYYGFDGNAPAGTLDFVTVVLHELGHGLGFATFLNDATGAEFMGRPDAFERNLEDDGVAWTSMTNAQRQASAIHTGHLVWKGAQVTANDGFLISGRDPDGHVLMYAPNPLKEGSSVSHFDTSLMPDQLLEPSYAVPIHDPSLTLFALSDVGWGAVGTTTTTTPGATTTTTTTLPLACPATPDTGCRAPLRSTLGLLDRPNDARDKLSWTWKGAGTALGDFDDPTSTSEMLRLCVYDASGHPQPLVSSEVLAGGTCGAHACWKHTGKAANPTGFLYHNAAATPDGVVTIKLKARPNGLGQIVLKGKGANLPLPALPPTSPVTVELLIGTGGSHACWQATYTGAHKNDTKTFKASAP